MIWCKEHYCNPANSDSVLFSMQRGWISSNKSVFTSGGKNQKDPGGSFPNAQFLAPMMPVYTVALMVFIGIRLRNWRL